MRATRARPKSQKRGPIGFERQAGEPVAATADTERKQNFVLAHIEHDDVSVGLHTQVEVTILRDETMARQQDRARCERRRAAGSWKFDAVMVRPKRTCERAYFRQTCKCP